MNKFVLVPFHEFKSIIETGSNKALRPDNLAIESILLSFPKNIKHKARGILEHIMISKCLEWNEKGEISVNNEIISNSHITDLIKCSLYPYKNIKPEGFDQFLSALSSSNIPQTLIQSGRGLPPPGIPSKTSKAKVNKDRKWSWHQM